jgi:hypothetical protein
VNAIRVSWNLGRGKEYFVYRESEQGDSQFCAAGQSENDGHVDILGKAMFKSEKQIPHSAKSAGIRDDTDASRYLRLTTVMRNYHRVMGDILGKAMFKNESRSLTRKNRGIRDDTCRGTDSKHTI